jgi:hypothetical protein
LSPSTLLGTLSWSDGLVGTAEVFSVYKDPCCRQIVTCRGKKKLDADGVDWLNPAFMKTLRFLFLSPLFAVVALAADNSAAAPTQTQPVSGPAMIAPPSAPADPAAVEAALKAMHYDEMIGKLVDQQKQMIITRLQQTLAMMKSSITSKEEFEAFEQKAVDDAKAGITPAQIHSDLARAYSEVFTTDELQAMANFYNTPAGQSVSMKQADLERKIIEVIRPRLMRLASDTQRAAANFAMLQQAEAKKAADEAAAAKAKDQKPASAGAAATISAATTTSLPKS